MKYKIKASLLLLIFSIMLVGGLSVFASEDKKTETGTKVAPDLAINVNLTQKGTAPFDSNNDPGNADGTTNVIRVNDYATYTIELTSNNNSLTDPILTVNLPKGLYMESMPGYCKEGSSITPKDPFSNVTWPISEDVNETKVQAQVITCHVNNLTSNVTQNLDLQVKLGNLVPNGYEYVLESIKLEGKYEDDGETYSIEKEFDDFSKDDTIIASAALKWDLSKNGTAANENSATFLNYSVNCPWDSSKICTRINYGVNVSAEAGGKGAMPAIGDISWEDDLSPRKLFPNLKEAQYQEIEANPGLYGARGTFVDAYYTNQPFSKIGANSNSTTINSVIDSGTYTSKTLSEPNAIITAVLQKSNFSLKTTPTQYGNSTNSIPAINGSVPAYAVSNRFDLYIPQETIKKFGVESSTSYTLNLKNQFENLEITGFDGAKQTNNYNSTPDRLYRQANLVIPKNPGRFEKLFSGVPGQLNNSPYGVYRPSSGPYWEGLPGGAVYQSVNNVAPGQVINSNLVIAGIKVGTDEFSALACDSWDESKLQLRSADVPASTSAIYGQGLGSNNQPVWISGLYTKNNVGIDLLNFKVQYAHYDVIPGNSATTGCGDKINGTDVTWYDNPADVPGNDPQLLAQGIYSNVNRVRVYTLAPKINNFNPIDSSVGVIINVSISQRINPDYKTEKGLIPNWAGVAFNYSDKLDFNSTLQAVNNGDISFTSSDQGVDAVWNPKYDAVRLSLVQTRIDKQVALKPAGQEQTAWSKQAPNGMNGDEVLFKLSPNLTNNAGAVGIMDDVIIEDCLPAGLDYTGSNIDPIYVIVPGIGQAPSIPSGGEIKSCQVNETYVRYAFEAEVNKPVEPIIVNTIISSSAKDGNFMNTATISSTQDYSTLNLRQSSAGGGLNIVKGVGVEKKLLTPIVQVNRGDASVYENMQWENTLRNTTDTPLAGGQMIDILPQQVNSDSYQGSLALVNVEKNTGSLDYTLYYTTDSSITNDSYTDAGIEWNELECDTTTCNVSDNITALKWVAKETIPSDGYLSAKVSMVGIKNIKNNSYHSSVSGMGDGLQAIVGPVKAKVNVISSNVGDYVWYNLARDGWQDNGIDYENIPAKDIKVNISGKDDLGNDINLSTTTDEKGFYNFGNLRSGEYQIQVVKPESASGFTIQNAEDIPEGENSVVDSNGVVSFNLQPNTSDLDEDAGLLVDGKFSFTKELVGSGVESFAVGDELEFEVDCQFKGQSLENYPQTVGFTVESNQTSWKSDTFENIPVLSTCSVKETKAGNANNVADEIEVNIGFDEDTQSGEHVQGIITNRYDAAKLEVSKKIIASAENKEVQSGNYFDIAITCVVEHEGEYYEEYSGIVSVQGESSVIVKDSEGNDVYLSLGSKCYGQEVGYGEADEHSVDYDSLDNAIEVKEDGQIKITASNTFYNRPYIKPVKPSVSEVGCGVEKELNIPDIKGLKYVVSKEGKQTKVSVKALEGYKIVEGATTEWLFDLSSEECSTTNPTTPIPTTGSNVIILAITSILVGMSALTLRKFKLNK